MEGFLRRYPYFKTQRARVVNVDCIYCVIEATIWPWFNLFQIPKVKAILPKNRWNKDEAGIIKGRGKNGLVVSTANYKAL